MGNDIADSKIGPIFEAVTIYRIEKEISYV